MTMLNPVPQSTSTTPLNFPKRVYSGLVFDNGVRYKAQSILTAVMYKPDVPSLEEAREIIHWASKKGYVK